MTTTVEPVEFRTGQRALTAFLSQYPQDVHDDAWAAMNEAATEHAGGDRPFTISNQALLAVGET